MTWRIRSVRKRILLLALVPVLSLFGLYVLTTSVSARQAINLARVSTVKRVETDPTSAFILQVNVERPLAMVYLAAPIPANLARLTAVEARTNHAVAVMRSFLMSGDTQNTASPGEKQAITKLLSGAAGLPRLRSQIASQAITRAAAFSAYNGLNDDVYLYLDELIASQETSIPLVTNSLALLRIGESEEMIGREVSLLLGDLTARQWPAADAREFAQLVGARRTMYDLTLPNLDPVYRNYYARAVTPQAVAALTQLENRVMADHRTGNVPPPVAPAAVTAAAGPATAVMARAGNQAAATLVQSATNAAVSRYVGLGVEGGIGLILVLVSIVVAILTARSLVRELGGLRQSALSLANEQLPEVVDRLALGQEVDVSAEAPDLPATTEEIGQVRDAFTAVQQTAVRAAVGQARLRQGMSEVFRNLARRSQSLLHRQLALLDAMERRARDPQELEDLFRIDHLTTRMRRHAESLIILSGHSPARGWRNPVPLVDVLRAAVAEVEDYTRIRATSATGALLVGPAVGDVIHMIAELAENATMFSPPNTPVVIHGDTVGKGFAIEIEDRGLGLSDEQLLRINDVLQNPPPFDPAASDQLGLFVASQLAKRHNIKISLRPSPYGGTTAIVLIPQNLVVPEGSHAKDPAAPALADSALRLKGRHALEATVDGNGGGGSAVVATGAPPWARDAALQDPAETADLGVVSLGSPASPGFADSDLSLGGTGPSGSQAVGGGSLGAGGLPGLGGGLPGYGGPDGGEAGLPRRVRQASLAPQLREPAAEPVAAAGGKDLWARSPEETRSTMTAMQQGWERGRSVFDAPADGPAGTGTTAGPEHGAGNGASAEGSTPADGPDGGAAGVAEPATEDGGTSD
jgi:signal transduction histidine kinase